MNKEKITKKLELEVQKMKLHLMYWRGTKNGDMYNHKITAYSEIIQQIKDGDFNDN